VVARELKVDVVVGAAVLRSGSQVRITAELIDASTGKQMWSGSYERSLGDVLALQSEVARAIAREIQAKVTPQEQVRLASSRVVNTQAYEAYLKGLQFFHHYSEESLSRAVEYFDQAVRLDPGYGAAHAGLAQTLVALESIGARPREEVLPEARAAATKALEIDDTLAEAHSAMATVYGAEEWDWPKCEKERKRAIELNPSDATLHFYYATTLRHLGRKDESIAQAKRALELDPLSELANEGLADAYASAREYDLAVAQYRRTLDLYPNKSESEFLLGWAYVHLGRFDEGIEAIRKNLALDGQNPELSPDLAYVYALLGRKDETRKILSRLLDLARQFPRSNLPGHIGLVYIALGQKEEALSWLEKAYQQHSRMVVWFKTDPRFDRLREEPRFQEMMRGAGLL
jgi:tetratricopeptide (TPR) repeat protein